ncbi:SRPBCC family protein [Paenibacillus taiwanensis]|uniref:SRPBCC family protein n=1 Tax=Paenibacillus taiwanensis TaxID=401638 RepID=UPI000418F0BD|nr:SRPBCC domain-containing protein [Paenibacillus taiwanensis]
MIQEKSLPDIVKTIILQAPILKVWDAVATSTNIAAWFMPNDFEPVLGHPFSIHSPYGVSPCKVTVIDPPYKLEFTWGPDWIITFQLKEGADGTTEFTLTHGGWKENIHTEAGMSHAEVRNRMDNGWESAVLPRLRELVEA